MKQTIKCRLGGMLAAACLLLLSGCHQDTFDAGAYMTSVVDSLYQGEHDEYQEFVEISEEEAEKAYLEQLRSEALYFGERFGFTQTDRTLYRTMAFYRALYQRSQYQVTSVENDNETLKLVMEIEPIDLFVKHKEEIEQRVLHFTTRITEGEFAGQSQEKIDCQYCDYLLDYLEKQLDTSGWGEPQTITVHMEKNQGAYVIQEEDLKLIDQTLVQYDSADTK